MKILADDKIPFLQGALEPFAEVIYLPGKEITRDAIIDTGTEALLIRTRTKCNEKLLRGTAIRFIATATIGFDHIDTEYCKKHNITWTNAPGCNSSSVQQYIASAMLTISSDFIFTLKDKTLGIIGVGNVGSKVAKFAKILGMKVLLNDPPRARREGEREFVNIDVILEEADIVTVHVPLNMQGEDKTFHLFDHIAFEKMKKGSWFFNSSRGEIADTAALKSWLKSSKPGGAVIDVWENEPDVDKDLLSKVFLATPHIAGYSTDGKANGTAMVVNSLSRFFNLPLENWYPFNVPGPVISEILIDCAGKSEEDIVREAVLNTYNIKEDDEKFRQSPYAFEKQRGDYPVRREFPSYTIKLVNSSEKAMSIIEKMGFTLDR